MKSTYMASGSGNHPTRAVDALMKFVIDAVKGKRLPRNAKLISSQMTCGKVGFFRRPLWNIFVVYEYDTDDL